MGLKTWGETMQSLNNASRRCAHVSAIFSPPGCALPKWGAGREAFVFTPRHVMQRRAKEGQTVGVRRSSLKGRVCEFRQSTIGTLGNSLHCATIRISIQ